MKKTITILIALILSLSGMAQTGLEFSQCLTFSGNGPWTAPYQSSSDRVSPQYVVPEGKIWKLEYAYVNQASNSFLRVNGFIASNLGNAHFPIWLKAGDTIDLYASSFPINNYNFMISILEFTNN